MKDITQSREKHLRLEQSRCSHFSVGSCQNSEGCKCALVADVRAYIETLIPSNCQNLTIDDFCGITKDGKTLDDKVVLRAKDTLVQYCWGNVPDKARNHLSTTTALKHSKIPDRYTMGTSLVIHGRSRYVEQEDGHTVIQKLGRSLIASIVMKEVIYRRLFDGHAADTYEWIQYPTMRARLMAKDNNALFLYQTCDWLVVDNILNDQKGSIDARAYAQSMLDAAMMERIEQRLPTILVFQFDIDQVENLDDIVGFGMSQIAHNDTTVKISLTSCK